MKSLRLCCASATGSALLITLLSLCQLSAAANPLNGPQGLALDSKGNLYVANRLGNNILVFNPNFVLMSSKTITASVNIPTSVAFDSAGNLYVGNIGSESVTQYSSAGAQNPAGTITAAINTPEAIAVDDIDDIYVQNGDGYVSIYSANVYPAPARPAAFLGLFSPSSIPILGIATHRQFFAWGNTSQVTVQYIGQILGSQVPELVAFGLNQGLAMVFDATGNLYVGTADQTVNFIDFGTNVESQFITLGFNPGGIVVDNARSRLYISNQQGNAIAVYSTTTAKLLKTIQ